MNCQFTSTLVAESVPSHIKRIEAKVALASVTLSPSTTPLVLWPRDPQPLGLRTKGKGLRINSAKSLVPRMTGSLFALSWTDRPLVPCVLGPQDQWLWPRDKGYRVAPLLRMTECRQLIGDVSLLP